jgi:hypothetical protein
MLFQQFFSFYQENVMRIFSFDLRIGKLHQQISSESVPFVREMENSYSNLVMTGWGMCVICLVYLKKKLRQLHSSGWP